VNPLKPSEDSEVMQLNRRLFFIDERIGGQGKWLKEQLQQGVLENQKEVEDKIILVGGSPFILRDELGKEVYFDQNGELTTRFGIKATPAIVVQDGENLKIVEVAINPVNGVGS
jgi:conjugal transfer pilus assembly protein TraW